jgi:hypothetical protein
LAVDHFFVVSRRMYSMPTPIQTAANVSYNFICYTA